jgi:hypothetical protein
LHTLLVLSSNSSRLSSTARCIICTIQRKWYHLLSHWKPSSLNNYSRWVITFLLSYLLSAVMAKISSYFPIFQNIIYCFSNVNLSMVKTKGSKSNYQLIIESFCFKCIFIFFSFFPKNLVNLMLNCFYDRNEPMRV